jgi:hypothetical protein
MVFGEIFQSRFIWVYTRKGVILQRVIGNKISEEGCWCYICFRGVLLELCFREGVIFQMRLYTEEGYWSHIPEKGYWGFISEEGIGVLFQWKGIGVIFQKKDIRVLFQRRVLG